jgi:heptosyltransferase-2
MPEAVIVRLPNWLGDTVMAVPAIRALRAHWPDARLILAGPWASLLAGQELADVVVDYPRRWAGRLRTADAVRSLRAEVAVLLPNSIEAALAAQYWGARRLIGFATGGRSWLLTEAVPLPSPRRHQVDEYLLLAERVGALPLEGTPKLAAPDTGSEQRRWARALLQEAPCGSPAEDGGRIGLHLGAAHGPSKRWPRERMVEFCRALAERGARAVLLGEPSEEGEAREVARLAPALNLVGRDRPELLPALLAELGVLVSGDTGVSHLAAALGTPVVTLFGPTDPDLTAPRGPARVVRWPVPCAPCFYRTCPIDHPCLMGVQAAVVVEEALRARNGRRLGA